MQKEFMFQFVNEEDDTEITRLFRFEPKTAAAKALFDRDDQVTLLGDYRDRELRYGVHDGAFDPGFTTYEVPVEQQVALMEEWRQHFSQMGFEVGPVVSLDATPQDFLFAILPANPASMLEGITVYPNPRYIWETEGCQYDQHISGSAGLKAIVEKYQLREEMEGTFSVPVGTDLETLKAALIAEGLEFNEDYQAFVEDHAPNDEDDEE